MCIMSFHIMLCKQFLLHFLSTLLVLGICIMQPCCTSQHLSE